MADSAKTAIWIYADLDVSPLGTQSRLAKELNGSPVLSRTVNQLCKTSEFDAIVIFCPEKDKTQVEKIIQSEDSRIQVVSISSPVKSKFIKLRKWSIESWRGGLGEYTQFDEDAVSTEMVQYGIENSHNVIMVCPAAAAVIDPVLLDEMCKQYYKFQDKMRFSFSQSPPGLCGCMYRLDLLHNIVQSGLSIGSVIAYDPENPHSDHIVHECAYKVPENIYSCFSRFIVDNWRSEQLVAKILSDCGQTPSASELVQRANDFTSQNVYQYPRELELEICCLPSLRYKGYPHTLQDRNDWNRKCQDMDITALHEIISQSKEYDDICFTFGGFGEPLSHPDIINFVNTVKSNGVFGLNIETDGILLTSELSDSLIDSGVDVITINVDAWSKETWQKTKSGHPDFEKVISNIEYILDASKSTNTAVVCSMVKTRETLADMEPFYDQWRLKKCPSILRGYNDYCGLTEDKNVMNMCPPSRFPCNQVHRQMFILSDGSVVQCGQDYKGKTVFGNIHSDSIADLWSKGKISDIRKDHYLCNYNSNELCKNCKEWFR